jgi:hypothetical protein
MYAYSYILFPVVHCPPLYKAPINYPHTLSIHQRTVDNVGHRLRYCPHRLASLSTSTTLSTHLRRHMVQVFPANNIGPVTPSIHCQHLQCSVDIVFHRADTVSCPHRLATLSTSTTLSGDASPALSRRLHRPINTTNVLSIPSVHCRQSWPPTRILSTLRIGYTVDPPSATHDPGLSRQQN